jgi:DNA polymerase I
LNIKGNSVNPKRLFLIDGMSHIYRAYFAIRSLSNSQGMATNAVYGFTSMLRKLIKEQKPEYIGVALDLEGPTVRHEKFQAYKATRKPMPPDLVPQIPYIKRVCDVFCVPVISFAGYEADDVIGTLSKKAVEQELETVVVTSDKDMLQLVSDHILVLDTMKDNLVMDSQKVQEKLGVRPDQVADLLGLWGDTSDNIPGAPGIGEKGAKELIQTFGKLESVLANWQQVKRKTYQESLRDNADQIRMSRELATIRQDLPIELDLSSLVLCEPDRKSAFELFSELEFKNLMEEFLEEEKHEPAKGEWFANLAGSEESLARLTASEKLFFEIGHIEGALGRKTAGIGCARAGAGDAVLFDLKDKVEAQVWRRLVEHGGKICWDSKLFLLSHAACGIQIDQPPDDVMLMAFLTAPNSGDFSLKRWAMDQLHISLSEEKSSSQGSLLPEPEKVCSNLCRQLDAMYRLYELLNPRLDYLGLRELYQEIELPLVPVLADMEQAGIKVDRNMLQQMSSGMEKQLLEVTNKIYQAAGTEFNINSTRQLGEILFEKLNLPILKKTRKTGGYSTDQAVLEELAQSYELPNLILEYRQIAKLKSTYVDALPTLINPKTGRVHTSFNQTGAATGRLSCSDPNLQNIPIRSEIGRLIRGAFVSEKGNLLISADYSQVELRILAHLSRDEVLVDAFRAGEDIHERTAREVFSEAELLNPAECRRRAKVINFGIVYGLSAFGLSRTLGISRDNAQAFIDAYFKRYSGVRSWLDGTLEEVRQTGCARTLFGRIRQIPDINSKDYNLRNFSERTAVNSPIQGTAADIVKIAMIRIHRALQERRSSAKILLQVHDELVLEVPEAEVESTRALVQEEMEGAASLLVPLKVDLNVADNWLEMK